ncbi:MAG: hydroxylamine reductase [Candidatus Muiribacteriota bacterium]
MFCYQCEQTAKGTGCDKWGVCGKAPETSDLQDLLIYATKGLGTLEARLRRGGETNREADVLVLRNLFSTVTNVNFDNSRIKELLQKTEEFIKDEKRKYYEIAENKGLNTKDLPDECNFELKSNPEEMGKQVSFDKDIEKFGPEKAGLIHLIIYGLKGMAAYGDHAHILGQDDDSVYEFFHQTLEFLTKDSFEVDELVQKSLKVGEVNIRVMEMLDAGNTGTYGHPEPTEVRITPVKGKAILVSGHDLKDLALLLEQTEGKDVNVYTHGEMLPTNSYPELKKYSHLIGNYGGAWQDQQKEFDEFPGPILMTTNCIQKPKESYKDRIFTTGLVAWDGVKHIDESKDFTPVIQKALVEPGFSENAEEKNIIVGFGRNTVLSVADKVIDAVKGGDIKHFFLVGGCDGAKPGRNYYTDFTQKLPKDTVILTLACGKYRFNKIDFGNIGELPRLMDIGQCNDAYSAVKIALALADAFETDVNSLPLSFILSWYEQKAVVILLSLLHLGIKNMRLGPTMPAFVKPEVYTVLKDNFNLLPVTTPEEDIKSILGNEAEMSR